MTELGPLFTGWAGARLTAIDAPGLAKQLDRGLAGLQLPATAVTGEAGYRWCAPLLDVLAERDLPLFIHPGPAGTGEPEAGMAEPAAGTASAGTESAARTGPAAGVGGAPYPAWWAALVPYVQQLHAAWFAFRAFGRPAYPRLRVCFAALAGLAPLHGERMAALLVFGSDRPYAQPHPDLGLGDAARHGVRITNPARLLHT